MSPECSSVRPVLATRDQLTTVVICDDRAAVRRALAQQLALPGPSASAVDITGVPDGFALLDALEATSPDLVLVGIHSGSTAGTEAVDLVLAMRPLATPIIFGSLVDIDLLAAAQSRSGGGLLVWELPGPGEAARQR